LDGKREIQEEKRKCKIGLKIWKAASFFVSPMKRRIWTAK
jgi:hypothetical protein